MATTELKITEDKYLFSFQDESQLWIPTSFFTKYPQFPFYGIIQNSDIYKDGKYSVTIDSEMQSDLLFHIKMLFNNYLKENIYTECNSKSTMHMYHSYRKRIVINGLVTPKRKEELLHYSLLFEMMNVTKCKIIYQYTPNIPSEYIHPSCIKEIFPSLEKLEISVITNYIKSDTLLNPNTDEYMKEYCRFCRQDKYYIRDDENYEYYTQSEMDQYNTISSSKLRKSTYNKTNNPELCDLKVNTECDDIDIGHFVIPIMKAFEAGVFDITQWNKLLGNDQLIRIMTTHIFPNITTLVYDDHDVCFQLSSIKKEYFPKLHVLCYNTNINKYNFETLFPNQLMSMIDTISLYGNDSKIEKEVISLLDDLSYNNLIHITGSCDIICSFPHKEDLIKKGYISINYISNNMEDYNGYALSNTVLKPKCYKYNAKQVLETFDITFKSTSF
ncbi:hypothetical protein WA158_007140 [Blastocystis sp. Blastoise]